uniref:Small ribosomal subunit protein uS9c n=1 Tax=Prototheca wickerhamii TaxID=3111 RepID=A0A067Z181_PROWI|nr:ribosomal protein S9 [Prototheca wickerhamii]
MSPTKRELIHSGGRKTASALVKLSPTNATENIFINDKLAELYFHKNKALLYNIYQVYQLIDISTKYNVFISVKGGGLSAQAQAIRLALCKAFMEYTPTLRAPFKAQGYLTRDARIKERRKYGLKKARKAPQYSKR